MGRYLSFALALALFSGCSSTRHYRTDIVIGAEKYAAVGSAMVEHVTVPSQSEQFAAGWRRGSGDYSRPAFALTRQLIYGGIDKGTACVSYREFADDTARPAFTQELKYDLGSSRIVTFQSLRMEILGADSNGIRYRILECAWPLKAEESAAPVANPHASRER